MILRKLVARFVTLHTGELMSFYPDIIIVMRKYSLAKTLRVSFKGSSKWRPTRGMLSVLLLLKNEQEKVRHKSTLLFFYIDRSHF